MKYKITAKNRPKISKTEKNVEILSQKLKKKTWKNVENQKLEKSIVKIVEKIVKLSKKPLKSFVKPSKISKTNNKQTKISKNR